MGIKTMLFLAIVTVVLVGFITGCLDKPKGVNAKIPRNIVTSDTILSGMIASLLPRIATPSKQYFLQDSVPATMT